MTHRGMAGRDDAGGRGSAGGQGAVAQQLAESTVRQCAGALDRHVLPRLCATDVLNEAF